MKILYMDLETTGLDWNYCQVIEVGCVVDDLSDPKPLGDLPSFVELIRRPKMQGEPYALHMNAKKILESIQHGLTEFAFRSKFSYFLNTNFKEGVTITAGGKNIGCFDFNFLAKMEGFSREGGAVCFDHYKIGARTVDPAILYARVTDSSLPNLQECLNRAPKTEKLMEGRPQHDSYWDCIAVAALVREYYNLEVVL